MTAMNLLLLNTKGEIQEKQNHTYMKDIMEQAFIQAMKDMGIGPKDQESLKVEFSINLELESEKYLLKKEVKTIVHFK